MTKSISERLCEIQKKLEAPKNQYNSFGKYKYRNKEDILEGVKSLLVDDEYIKVDDELVFLEGRFYIKSTASFHKGNESISASAFAREAEHKKGMDASQVTGATSSYSGKYALGNLLAIDDNKDPDTDEPKRQEQAQKKAAPPQKMIKDHKDFEIIKADITKFHIDAGTNWENLPITRFQDLANFVTSEIARIEDIQNNPMPDGM